MRFDVSLERFEIVGIDSFWQRINRMGYANQRHIEGAQRDEPNSGSAGSWKAATRTAIDRETFPNDSRTMSLCSDSNFAVRLRQQLCQKSAQLERRYRLV
jgi:hypothetical protein